MFESLIPRLSSGAEIQGDWIAEVAAKGAEPQYARVKLRGEGPSVTGTWNQLTLTGKAAGDRLSLSLLRNGAPAGSLTAAASGGGFSGEGRMKGSGRGGRRAGKHSGVQADATGRT
jgi:hypothetical protein